MNRYIQFVIARPVSVIVFLFIVTGLMVLGIPKLDFDNSVEAFLPQTDPEYAFYDKSKDIYGDNSRFFIMKVTSDDLFSPRFLASFEDLITDLEAYETFNPQQEKGRLERVTAVLQEKNITGQQLLDSFADDPSFFRTLDRTVATNRESVLSQNEKAAIKQKIQNVYALKKDEVIDSIISPFTVSNITGKDDMLEPYDLVPLGPDNNRIALDTAKVIEQFRHDLQQNPSFEQGLYARDKKTGEITDFAVVVKYINLKNQDIAAKETLEIARYHQQKGLDIMPQGSPVINIWFNDYMRKDLHKFLPFIMLVVVIIFYFNFRSVRGVLLPLTALSMALIWVLGAMGYAGVKITAVGISLPPLMIAVGSSYSIHILNQFYKDRALIERLGLKKGLGVSMYHISTTVLLAGLTTFAAFITLSTSQLTAMRDWGIFSAIGVLFAVFISCSLIPAGLVLWPEPRKVKAGTRRSPLIDIVVQKMGTLAVNHPKLVVGTVVVMLLAAVGGIHKLNVESEFLHYFKDDDYIRTSATVVEDKFGGRWGYSIQVDSGKTNGVKDPAFLQRIETIRNHLTDPDNPHFNTGRTDAFTDPIKTMHQAMNNDNPAFYKIPENKADIWDYLEIYSGEDDNGDGRVDSFESFVDPYFRVCNILARLKRIQDDHLGSSVVERVIGDVKAYLDKTVPEQYSVRVTGFPVMYIKLAHHIVAGQFTSLLLCFGIIAVIVTLLFCDIKAGLLSLIPMGFAVTLNFGIMGWTGINLDTVTSVIAAITIGIGVDDTIHFLNTFRFYRSEGHSMDETIKKTLNISGTAIIYTSLALIFGFAVLTLSSFKPLILFGLLMGITMIATTLGALIVLPAVIKLTGVEFVEPGKEPGLYKYVSLGRIFGLQH